MAQKRCPKPEDCLPPSPLVPVYENAEYCSEVTMDRCVVHTGPTLATIGANDGSRLDTILANIDALLVPEEEQPLVIWESREAALEGITGPARQEATLVPVRDGDLVTFYWFQGGTNNINFIPYETSGVEVDALLRSGAVLNTADDTITLTGTRWRLNDTVFTLTTPVPYTIPPADTNGLFRIDNIVGDFEGNLTYQTGIPGAEAQAPDVAYKNILITTLYVSNVETTIVSPPVYVPEGAMLFSTGDPAADLGKEGNSYLNQIGGQIWKKEIVNDNLEWVLKFTPLMPTLQQVTDAGNTTMTQVKIGTTVDNSNYKLLVGGGLNVESGVLNMNEYSSNFNMSGGRVLIFADGNGMRFRLFNNDLTDHPDTSKSFSFYNKGFEHMRLYSDATSLNGQGQPATWEFRTRINYRVYLPHTAASTGDYKILTRNVSTNEVEYIEPIVSVVPTFPDMILYGGDTLVNGSNPAQVIVSPIGWYIDGVTTEIGISTTLTLAASDPTLTRIDLVVATKDGNLQIIQGTADINYVEPNMPADTLLIRAVTVTPTGLVVASKPNSTTTIPAFQSRKNYTKEEPIYVAGVGIYTANTTFKSGTSFVAGDWTLRASLNDTTLLATKEEVGIEDITYTNLLTKITSSTLVRGKRYRITDYQTVHTIPESSPSATFTSAVIEPLTVTAYGVNTLEPIAYSELWPKDIIYYTTTNSNGSTKGSISRRIDTIQNVDVQNDFRYMVVRRYKFNPAVYNVANAYAKNAVVIHNNAIYALIKTAGFAAGASSEPTVSSPEWVQLIPNNTLGYFSPTRAIWNQAISTNVTSAEMIRLVVDTASFIDVPIFQDYNTNPTKYLNIKIEYNALVGALPLRTAFMHSNQAGTIFSNIYLSGDSLFTNFFSISGSVNGLYFPNGFKSNLVFSNGRFNNWASLESTNNTIINSTDVVKVNGNISHSIVRNLKYSDFKGISYCILPSNFNYVFTKGGISGIRFFTNADFINISILTNFGRYGEHLGMPIPIASSPFEWTVALSNKTFVGNMLSGTADTTTEATTLELLTRAQTEEIVFYPALASGGTTTASNGLTKTGNDIKFGGIMTGTTSLDGGGFNLNFSNIKTFYTQARNVGGSYTNIEMQNSDNNFPAIFLVASHQPSGTSSHIYIDQTGTTFSKRINVGLVTEHADNAAAIAAGRIVGDVYRTGDIMKIVH